MSVPLSLRRWVDAGRLRFAFGEPPPGVAADAWAEALYAVVRRRWGPFGTSQDESIEVAGVEPRAGGGWRVVLRHAIDLDFCSQYDRTARGTAVVELSPSLAVVSEAWEVDGPVG